MISMALHDRIRKLTYDDYVLIPEDGQRHEIIDGEHYMTPSPVTSISAPYFGWVCGWADSWSSTDWAKSFRLLLMSSSRSTTSSSRTSCSSRRSGREILTDKNVQGTPDLVVEILSESTRQLDEKIKLPLYDRYGALEYWIFNAVHQDVRIFHRTGDRLALVAELSAKAGDVLTTPLLPGFELSMAGLFA